MKLKLKNLFKSSFTPSKDYLYIRDIIQKWVDKEDSKIIMSSVGDDCYVSNEQGTIKIYISDRYVQISNHRSLIQKMINLDGTEKLKKIVETRVKRDVLNFKKEVKDNEDNLLREIFNYE